MEGKELPSGAHGSAGEVRAARVAGRAGWAGCARRGARECGPARTEGEAGDWAVREGVARSGPGRWVVGRAGQARGLLSVSEGRWAGSVKELAREGKRENGPQWRFAGPNWVWVVFLISISISNPNYHTSR